MTPAIVDSRPLRKILVSFFIAAGGFAFVAAPHVVFAQSKISGAAISKVARDTRKLTVSAQSSGGTAATGTIQFIHNSPAGLSRFRGSVSCLSVSGGTVQVSGTIDKGETATGALLDGKAYAFTISTASNPQTFSLPNYGDAGSIAPCSGGRSETVPVTEDGFKIQ